MGGNTKSSSREQSMFGHFCKAYRCFISRLQKKHFPSKKHKALPDPKDLHGCKSFDEMCKELNDKSEARRSTNDLIHGLESHKANEVHRHYDIFDSPKIRNSNKSKLSTFSRTSSGSHGSRKFTLFRSSSQTVRTETQEKLPRSLTRHTADNKEPNNVGSLKKSRSINNLDNIKAQSGALFRSSSRNGTPDIVYSNLNGLAKLLMMEKSLECTLEDLCFGCVKKVTIDRNVIASNGKIVKEKETLSIKVKPGWKKGTKIVFEGVKNEEKGTHSCDVNFLITEKKHSLYRREGDDLELAVRVSLVQSLTGCTLCIPLLGGEKMNLTLDEIIVPGYQKLIEGQGMPKSKEKGQRGNLKLTFLIDFPTELSEDQRSEIVSILQDSF